MVFLHKTYPSNTNDAAWYTYLNTSDTYYHFITWKGMGGLYTPDLNHSMWNNQYDNSRVQFDSGRTRIYFTGGEGTVYGFPITQVNVTSYRINNNYGELVDFCFGLLHSSLVSNFDTSATLFSSGISFCFNQSNGLEFGCQTCAPCHDYCEKCEGGLVTQCTACKSGYFKQPNSKTCASTCPDPYIPDPTTKSCKLCHNYCAECFGATVDDCTSCNSGYYLQPSPNQNTCADSCPANSIPDSSTKTCLSN